MRFMLQQIDDIEHHVDVGTRFAFTGQRWAIDNLESSQIERRPEALIGLRVQVTATNQHPTLTPWCCRLRQRQGINQPIHPDRWITGKLVSRFLIKAARQPEPESDEQG